MARIPQDPFFSILTISLLFSSLLHQALSEVDDFLVELDRKQIKEKFSHFRLYWHDICSGHTPTSVPVLKPIFNTSTGFGQVNIIDNPLTLGPELTSKVIGKAQGFYAFTSQEEVGLLMAMNFVFTYGKYNGSTITILGRNAAFNKVREMPVIGGTGLFRYARGYVEIRTYMFDPKSSDAIVEYNVYVMHY